MSSLREGDMAKSILKQKKILIVDDESLMLELIEDAFVQSCPGCRIKKAGTYNAAVALMISQNYDLVILGIEGERGFALLKIATERNFKILILANTLSTKDMNISYRLGAVAYLPKTILQELSSFCEDLLEHGVMKAWQYLVDRLEISYMVGSNSFETYRVLCFARFFVEKMMLTPNQSS